MHKSVDAYIAKHPAWIEQLEKLRGVALSAGLDETVKWGMPTYQIDGKNVAGLGAFKKHICLWFFNGALLNDPEGVLMNAQEGKTKAMRQWRFVEGDKINTRLVKKYLKEAAGNQAAGKEIKAAWGTKITIPPELQAALKKNKTLHTAFSKLSPGERRLYAEYISDAKREPTKLSRIEKIKPMIKTGIGLNDNYK